MEEPDSGLWEFRNQVQVHTYTLLFHWAGAKAAYKIGSIFKDEGLMEKAQKNLSLASSQIDELMGKRTRAINRKLQEVDTLPLAESEKFLPDINHDNVEDD